MLKFTVEQVFLNDWGSAAEKNKEIEFAGALNFAATAILEAIGNADVPRSFASVQYTARTTHDLEMLVKVDS